RHVGRARPHVLDARVERGAEDGRGALDRAARRARREDLFRPPRWARRDGIRDEDDLQEGRVMDIESKLRALAGAGAGWIMWVLVATSVLVVAIALERAIVIFLQSDDVERLRRNLTSALGRGDLVAARRIVVASRSVEARVLEA